MRQLCSVLWLLCLACSWAMADDLNIAGRVTIAGSEDPLPGVTVNVKGTTISTVTSPDGTYALTLKGMSQATIEYSFLGFKTKEEAVTSSNASLNVGLEEAPLEVQEAMVVTGFATNVKRKNLANSVATFSAEELSRVKAPTLDSALSGISPGVSVSANTGAPGGGIGINMRGTSTINGSSQPLFVVDGVIVSNAQIQSGVNAVTNAAGGGNAGANQDQPSNRLADLITSDVESMEVLKGPSAAAIYGSKASNGVVIITTKRGKAGEPSYDFNQGFGQRSIIKKLGARRYTRETAIEQWGSTLLTNLFGDLTNWNPEYFDHEADIYGEKGSISETNFTARGGNEKTRYYFAGTNLDDEGIVARTGYEKTGLRLNLDHNFTDRLDVSLNVGLTRSKARRGLTGNDNAGTTWGVSISQTPSFINLRPTMVNGVLVYPDNPFNSTNHYHIRDVMRNVETVDHSILATKLNYNIYESAQQALDFNITAGVDYFAQENDSYFPNELQSERNSAAPGAAILGETENMLNNFYANLTHTLYAGDNTFRTTGGVQYEELDFDRINLFGDNLIPGQSNVDQATSITADHTRTIQKDQGFFLQEEVNLGEAVMLTAGVRGDRSSRNGDTDKIYSYPKASASIRLSEYEFFSGLKDSLSEFKFRIAWGATGNLPVPAAKYSGFAVGNVQGQGGLIIGASRGNPNIKPERAEEIELGFDGTFWGGKGTFEVTHFDQTITDLLLLRQVEPSSGNTSEWFNGGEMGIDGQEVSLSLNPVQTADFNWITKLNYSTAETIINELIIPAYNTGGFALSLGQYRIEEGLSPTTIVGRNAAGQRVILGDEAPDFRIGWDNSLTYGNYSLSWLLDWKEGGEVINLTSLLYDLGGNSADYDTAAGQARRDAYNNGITAPFIEDGSYIRLRELKFQYSLGASTLKSIVYGRLSRLDLSIQGRNVKTWTDYSSYDPEVSNFGTTAIGGSVEVTPFPSSKAWYFNISVGL